MTHMMTEAQREAAARELCRLRGYDPMITPLGASINWLNLALREIDAAEQLAAAIAKGREA